MYIEFSIIHAEWPSLGTGIFPNTLGVDHFRVSELKCLLYTIYQKQFNRKRILFRIWGVF